MARVPMLKIESFSTCDNQNSSLELAHEVIMFEQDIKGNKTKPHVQKYYEIIYFLKGSRDIWVGDNLYSCSDGDIIVVNPNEPHRGVARTAGLLDRYFLHIYPDAFDMIGDSSELLMSCFLNRPFCKNNMIRLTPGKSEKIRNLFSDIINTAQGCTSKRDKLFVFTKTINMLLLLNEYYENRNNYLLGERSELIIKILDYININFIYIGNISEIEKKFGVSRSWLWRIFKEQFNMSPKQYILYKRLTHARYLLQCGESVTNACMYSGFSDCSHFIKLFRRTFGVTPLNFRNSACQQLVCCDDITYC